MPFNLSFTHLAVVGIVALVVLGPERLPGVARTAGAFWKEWLRIRGSLEGEVREVLNEFKEPFTSELQDVQSAVRGLVDDFHGSGTAGQQPAAPITELAPLTIAPLALPSLGEGTALVSPGPVLHNELPVLGPSPQPETFVPYDPS